MEQEEIETPEDEIKNLRSIIRCIYGLTDRYAFANLTLAQQELVRQIMGISS